LEIELQIRQLIKRHYKCRSAHGQLVILYLLIWIKSRKFEFLFSNWNIWEILFQPLFYSTTSWLRDSHKYLFLLILNPFRDSSIIHEVMINWGTQSNISLFLDSSLRSEWQIYNVIGRKRGSKRFAKNESLAPSLS